MDVIFVPKYRKRFLVGHIKTRFLELFTIYTMKYNAQMLAVEIMPDHVHLFLSGKRRVAPSQMALYLKGWTSKVLREEVPFLKSHQAFWTPSYVVYSSGNVSFETIKRCIEACQDL
ncbi:MAG: IS200/IS605 family transposase [Candidatus Hermodarchaeota archaeon]